MISAPGCLFIVMSIKEFILYHTSDDVYNGVLAGDTLNRSIK